MRETYTNIRVGIKSHTTICLGLTQLKKHKWSNQPRNSPNKIIRVRQQPLYNRDHYVSFLQTKCHMVVLCLFQRTIPNFIIEVSSTGIHRLYGINGALFCKSMDRAHLFVKSLQHVIRFYDRTYNF